MAASAAAETVTGRELNQAYHPENLSCHREQRAILWFFCDRFVTCPRYAAAAATNASISAARSSGVNACAAKIQSPSGSAHDAT